MVALAESLRTSFAGSDDPARTSPSDAHTSAITAFTQSGSGEPPSETDLPPRPLIDTSALGRLASRFTNLDMSGIDRAVGSSGASATVTVPGAEALMRPIAPLLELVDSLRGDGAMALLAQLRQAPAEPTVGMAGIEASLGQLLGVRQSAAMSGLLGTVRGLFPVALDIDGPIGQVGDIALTARDLITMLGALMAIHTAAVELRDTSAMIDQLLAPETATALIQRAQVWSESDAVVAAVNAVSDPEDDLQVEAAAQAVAEVCRAIADVTDALTRAMAFGEATLVHADPARSAQAIDVAAAQLRSVEARRIRASVDALAGLIARVLPAGAAPPIDLADGWATATALSAQAVTAVTAISAAPLTRPVQQALGTVTSVVHDINRVFGEISGAIRGAFATVRGAVAAIDLQGIAREIQRFLQPVIAALQEVDAFIQTVKQTIADVAGKITAAITKVTEVLTATAGHLKDAFAAVHKAFDELHLQQVIDTARAEVQTIADALHQVQLQPYFDKAIEVMNTGADVISAVPLGLLPDSAKQELDKVIQPIRAIDFKGQVVDVLENELHEILSRVDTDVLQQLDAAFQQVVQALVEFDPQHRFIDPLDQQYDAFVQRVKDVNPEEILKPVVDAVDRVRAEIAKIDLRARVLDPLEHGFAQIVGVLDQLDPTQLLQPIEAQVAGIRQQILDVTHIDQWADKVESVHRAIDAFLTRIDLTDLGPRLDALVDNALAFIPGGGDGGSVIGSLIASLVEGLGLAARPRSFVAVMGWITGDDGSAEVRALVAAAAASLAHAHTTVAANDLRAIGARLDVGFRRLRAAVEAKGAASSRLRLRIDPMLAAAATLDALGALGDSQARYLAALDTSARAVEAMTARGLSEIAAGSGDLRSAFQPLASARGRVLALGRALGVDLAGKNLREILAPLLQALRPSRLLTLVGPVITAVRDKVREILVDGLLTPVQAGIAELNALVQNLDISVFRTELDALFAQVKAELEAFRPSVVLGPIFTELETLRDDLATYDPLQPVKAIIAALRAAIDTLATEFRPSTLLAELVATYDEVVAIAQGLNVRTLLEPILTALHDLEGQLDTGLDGSATAFAHLQDALGGASSSGSASAQLTAGAA